MRNIAINSSFRIVTRHIPKLTEIENIGGKLIFSGNGYLAKFFLTLQEYLGFRYEILIEERYGIKTEDGNWTGKAGYVYRNEADISIPHVITYDHYQIIDFAVPYDIYNIIFCVKKGEKLSELFGVVYPFSIRVWISTFVCFLIGIFFFYIIFNSNAKCISSQKVTLTDITWGLLSSFINQGNALLKPIRHSCRILAIAWIFAIFVLTASYSGALVSFLINPSIEYVPRTFPELFDAIDYHNYTAAVPMKSGIGKYIKDQKTNTAAKLKYFLDKGYIEDYTGDFPMKKYEAVIGFDTEITHKLKMIDSSDEFLLSTDFLYTQAASIGLNKRFPFKNEFNKIIRRCLEGGIKEKIMYDEEIRDKKTIRIENKDSFDSLKLNELLSAFGILIIGYVISFSCFIVEMLSKFPYHKYFPFSNNLCKYSK